MQDGRWVEVSPSQFDHERQGLNLVKALLPDAPPFRAWSNFEFRDNRGRWHEVDLLVLARDTLYLIELKYYSGVLNGNDHVWSRGGHRSEDSPLLLTRRKAQYFSSLLKERLQEATGTKIGKGVIPYVQEIVFLHHQNLRCALPESSKKDLYGLPGSGLPEISQVLLAPPRHELISEPKSLLIRDLMAKIGLVPRRQREVGSWVIDEQPLGHGEGWQDWPAFHHVDMEQQARIRFYLPKPGASQADEHARVRAIEHEYRLLKRLKYDGLQIPADVVKDKEMGIGLVFDQPKDYVRLDLWLVDHKAKLTLDDQLELIGDVAAIVQYAHRHRVVHRVLSPRAVSVRSTPRRLTPVVTDWDSAGVLPANAETGVTKLSGGPLSLVVGEHTEMARLFTAPEGRVPSDPARLDVFGLGALAFYLLTGGSMPAGERGELLERLRRDKGLDLAAEMPQVPSVLRQVILRATCPSPAERVATVAEFLELLEDARKRLVGSVGTDPLEVGPGAELDGKFTYVRKLGAGSSAVAILVTDQTMGDAHRVLKVAKDDAAAARLVAEAQVLGRLANEPRIVTLHANETVGGRRALVLQFAGSTTLAEELSSKGRLSIDLLERWGRDLLSAVVALEAAGVTHRDIKPANLGVWAPSQRADSHLLMFDFSMAGTDPRDVDAGTPPYLDPFLGLAERRRYDTAAERYGAAVVLFEMATGRLPQYGPDPGAHAATVDDDVAIDLGLFDPAVAAGLSRFFTAALARDVTDRLDTAEDMMQQWSQVFTELDATPQVYPAAAAEKATAVTPLAAAGLSARAVSALAPVEVTTVGELLALDSAKLNRVVAKETRSTRTEIRNHYRAWRKRLGEQKANRSALIGLDQAVELLLAAAGARSSTRRAAAELLLGERPGLDAFANVADLATALDKVPQRGHQLIKQLQDAWSENDATRTLLDGVIEAATQLLRDSGGVAAISMLTAEVQAMLPQSVLAQRVQERAAAGLLRAAFDRLTEHESAEGAKRLLRRRRDGMLTLVANDEVLLAATEAAARRADELVGETTSAVIPAATAARELRTAFAKAYEAVCEPGVRAAVPPDSRLIRLAAAASRKSAASGRGELHSRYIGSSDAVRVALSGLAQSESLEPGEIRARVGARFPECLTKLPPRPQLDSVVERAQLGLTFTEGKYRFKDAVPASITVLRTRDATENSEAGVTRGETAWVGSADENRVIALRESLDGYGFLAIGATVDRPGDHTRVANELAAGHHGEIVDVTSEIVIVMREFARQHGVSWDLVRGADAAGSAVRDARGLRAVVEQVVPSVTRMLDSMIFDGPGDPSPVILTELSPLARYGYLDALANWADLAAPRRRPVWAILPQLPRWRGPHVDGKPIQLSSPGGQFVVWERMSSTEKVI